MKILTIRLLVSIFIISGYFSLILAQNDSIENKISLLLQEIKNYDYGESRLALTKLDGIVKNALNSNENLDLLENEMIDFLEQDVTFEGKKFICQQLSLIGTEKSVDVLLYMMQNPSNSDIARYALEKISSNKVDTGLLSIIDSKEPNAKIGIINTLAKRKSKIAVKKIGELASSKNFKVSHSASFALGEICGEESIVIIEKLLDDIKNKNTPVLLDSYLRCADELLLNGNNIEAKRIFNNVLSRNDKPSQRIAALKGLVQSSPESRDSIILFYLQGKEYLLRQVVLTQISYIEDNYQLDSILKKIKFLPPNIKIDFFLFIKDTNQKYFADAAREACISGSDSVKIAAIKCLRNLGVESDVDLFLKTSLDNNILIKEESRNSLYNLKGESIDQKILDLFDASELSKKIELIYAISERKIKNGFNKLINSTKSENVRIRLATYDALGSVSSFEQLSDILDIFINVHEDKELSKIENTLAKVMLKNESKNDRTKLILETLDTIENFEKQMSLLRIIGVSGDENAFIRIKEYLKSDNAEVKKTAIQSLYNWPNLEPLEDLIKIVETSENNIHRTLALRGYINLLKNHGLADEIHTMDYYNNALKYSESDIEKKMILSGLAKLSNFESVSLAMELFADVNVKPEAEMALLELLDNLRWSDPDRVNKILTLMYENSSSKETSQQIKKMLDQIEKK